MEEPIYNMQRWHQYSFGPSFVAVQSASAHCQTLFSKLRGGREQMLIDFFGEDVEVFLKLSSILRIQLNELLL